MILLWEWHRTPRLIDMGQVGDAHKYLWVAEPTRGEVYGVAYYVSSWMLAETPSFRDGLRLAAYAELFRRVKAGDKHSEGECWEAFMWHPIITRDEETGMLSVGDQLLDVMDTEIGPFYHPVKIEGIDLNNLYVRPGRFIAVNGPSDGDNQVGPGSGT